MVLTVLAESLYTVEVALLGCPKASLHLLLHVLVQLLLIPDSRVEV